MEFKHLTTEEFINLSSEEKKEYVRNLIHSEAAHIHAAFLNPATGEVVNMRELVEQVGEEKALEIITKALESPNTDTKALSGKDIKELVEKAKRGECTPEELAMLDFITQEIINNDDHIQFERHWTELTLNLINFAQEDIKCNVTLSDLLAATVSLVTLSGMASNNGALSKYTPGDVSVVSEIGLQIADDIYNTWEASCTSLPEPEFVIAGLLQLATRIAFKNNIELSKATDIANIVGIKLDDISTENGSNEECEICQPVIHKPVESENEEDSWH